MKWIHWIETRNKMILDAPAGKEMRVLKGYVIWRDMTTFHADGTEVVIKIENHPASVKHIIVSLDGNTNVCVASRGLITDEIELAQQMIYGNRTPDL